MDESGEDRRLDHILHLNKPDNIGVVGLNKDGCGLDTSDLSGLLKSLIR